MNSGISKFFCLCGLIAFASGARANVSDATAGTDMSGVSTDQPYSAIWVRNVFDLKPKDPPPSTAPTETAPPSNIKLMGIYTIFGKRALLGVLEGQMPGQAAKKEECYNMSEGERRGSLEILEINPNARTVKIKNDQIVSTITFETNKPAGATMPNGRPTGFGGGMGQPAFHPTGMPVPGPLPSRMTRPPSTQNNFQPSAAGYQSGYTGANTGTTLNNLFNQPQNHQNAPAPTSDLTAEEQVAAVLMNQKLHENDPVYPPAMPPIPGLNLGGTGTGAENNSTTTPANNPTLPPWLRNRTIPSFGGAPPPPAP
ncbi:MAG TPA: hypothetical protein VG754_03720 [Verrucomicrobiae bacterium]|jgi:hypothetical protein|nr:hypothetical protein [Verrucomicrobiae bacterium]